MAITRFGGAISVSVKRVQRGEARERNALRSTGIMHPKRIMGIGSDYDTEGAISGVPLELQCGQRSRNSD